MANMAKIEDKLALLPSKPGCYLMKDEHGKIIYVGKAIKLNNRVRSYFRGVHDFKTTKLVAHIDDFEYIVCGSEKEALLMEINLIKEHTPQYNIMFMDDKSYPYIKLSKGKAPLLSVVRNNKDKKAYYYGPFPNSSAAWDTKNLLNKLYPLRKCKKIPKKACLYYHLGQCLGPCIQDVDEAVYEKMASEIRKFLRGDTKEILTTLKKDMQKASDELNFEKAQEIHELIQSIEHISASQNVMFKDRKDRDVFGYYFDKGYICIQGFLLRQGKIIERNFSITPIVEEVEDAFVSYILQYYENNPLPQEVLLPQGLHVDLNEYLDCSVHVPLRGEKKKLVDMVLENAKNAHINKFELVKRKDDEKEEAMLQLSTLLKKEIHTIEIYDNSHIAGKFNVSGMVVFEDGLPNKKEYRLYKLQGYRSDLDSMKEVVYRRYLRLLKEQKKQNDLLLVDGGFLQIQAAKEILDALEIDITLAGLVKDDKHRTSNLMDVDGNIIDIKKDSPLFFLLTQMQDEVHRFAITYHKNLRKKAQTKSILDEVEGLGEVRKKKIWQHFKSLKNLKEASVSDIAQVVPTQVAENIYALLHDTQE
ncbi:MAG: excinuclease ABC subunit UvrC [Erysipelotrichia bacterium]|nr:excinuclease ABC subunit UvrC [Erysipelotrichia bacterium]NCC53964.1 excinuclease ABC subunit UvrC [Erysipelotrichia bacterium]